MIWVPVTDDKCPAGYRLEQQPILFPHRIIKYLFDECHVTIPEAEIQKFWDHSLLVGEPFAHPVSSPGRIPIGFYGDAAQLITKVRREKLMCFWMNLPLFRPRSVRYSRFLLWTCDSRNLFLNRTTNAVLRWICWSMNILYDGVNPYSRPGGRQLTRAEAQRAGHPVTNDHHLFQVTELRGDWEFHKFVWNFKSSWVSIHVCFRCPAMTRSDDVGLLYWNADDENSTWAQAEFSTDQYIARRLYPRHVCAMLQHLHFFWARFTVKLRHWDFKGILHGDEHGCSCYTSKNHQRAPRLSFNFYVLPGFV